MTADGVAGAGSTPDRGSPYRPPSGNPLPSAWEERWPEALEVLEDAGPEYTGEMANYGPMAAEALYVLRRGDAAPDWARSYRTPQRLASCTRTRSVARE